MKLRTVRNPEGQPWSAAELVDLVAKEEGKLSDKLEQNHLLRTVMIRTMRELTGFMSANGACNAMLGILNQIDTRNQQSLPPAREEEVAVFLSLAINHLLTAPEYTYVIRHFTNAFDWGRYSARAVILYRITTPEVIAHLRKSGYGSIFSAEFSRGAELFSRVA